MRLSEDDLDKDSLLSDRIRPAVELARTAEQLVACVARKVLAHLASRGRLCSCSFQNCSGSCLDDVCVR